MSTNKENKYFLELDNKIKDLVTERQKVIKNLILFRINLAVQ